METKQIYLWKPVCRLLRMEAAELDRPMGTIAARAILVWLEGHSASIDRRETAHELMGELFPLEAVVEDVPTRRTATR